MSYDDIMNDLKQATRAAEDRLDLTNAALSSAIEGRMSQNVVAPSNGIGPSSVGGGLSSGDSPRLDAFYKAIIGQESGGNYHARNSGSGAAGAYQIMPGNFVGPGGWDKETIGRNVSLKAFLNHPKIQDNIAEGMLAKYFKQYGPAGAAKAWYAGPGNADTNSDAPQYGGPSINDYAAAVIDRMRTYLKRGRR